MRNNTPDGVLIKVNEIKERCGNCNKPLFLETYLNTLNDQRSYSVLCKTCNLVLPAGEDYY